MTTREGKPYWRVCFRDAAREVHISHLGQFPLGGRLPRASGRRGCFSRSGPSTAKPISARNWKSAGSGKVAEADAADGFDPDMCLPQSRFDPQAMFDELLAIVRQRIARVRWPSWWSRSWRPTARRCLRLPAAAAESSCLRGRAGWSTP